MWCFLEITLSHLVIWAEERDFAGKHYYRRREEREELKSQAHNPAEMEPHSEAEKNKKPRLQPCQENPSTTKPATLHPSARSSTELTKYSWKWRGKQQCQGWDRTNARASSFSSLRPPCMEGEPEAHALSLFDICM